MSSAICQNFVQNAWKKELCSNCFKSKDEHVKKNAIVKPLLWRKEKDDLKISGIIKRTRKKCSNNNNNNNNKYSVSFSAELSKVIGYGGEDWSDNDEDFMSGEDASEDNEYEADGEEEKEMKRITKANTDFNTVNENLLSETKKTSYKSLKLGTPQIDSTGKKQTLLVTVTPFGEGGAKPLKIIKTTTTTAAAAATTTTATTTSAETEKSLLEEISETLEKGTSGIHIMENNVEENNATISTTSTAATTTTMITTTTTTRATSTPTERKVLLTRAPVIKRPSQAKLEVYLNKETKKDSDSDDYEDVSANDSLTESLKDERESKEETTSEEATKNTPASRQPGPGSRESAGEPDGRADPPDVSTLPPLLPTTPPPSFETRSSFLHGPGNERSDHPPPPPPPPIPSNPSTILIRKPVVNTNHLQHHQNQNVPMTTFSSESSNKTTEIKKELLAKHDSNGSDYGRFNNKRRAPMPPPPPPIHHHNLQHNHPSPSSTEEDIDTKKIYSEPQLARYVAPPEAPPRNLGGVVVSENNKRKENNKTNKRFFLKKFLRKSSSSSSSSPSTRDVVDTSIKQPQQQQKQQQQHESQSNKRLVIVHPNELNGEEIQVVANKINNNNNNSNNKSYKPTPPPRNLELYNGSNNNSNNRNNNWKRLDTLYANIGEVRSSIMPNKPQRTASMREREAALEAAQTHKQKHLYEAIGGKNKNDPEKVYRSVLFARDVNENLYDYIGNNKGGSSSPECDKDYSDLKKQQAPSIINNKNKSLGQRSCSSVDVPGEVFKTTTTTTTNALPRSASLTYCGSETESEIYSPCGFYGSEGEIFDDEKELLLFNGCRTHKLRSRKGRSIVHKNLEDNYGAVVVANHEALAQVLENITHLPTIMPALRGLKTASNLRWSDFTIKENEQKVVLGPRIFYQALWGAQHVTLVVNVATTTSSSLSLGNFNLIPITEFVDLVPIGNNNNNNNKGGDCSQATISVHPWLQIHSIKSYGEYLKSKANSLEELGKEGSLVVLQLINALKMLQAQGIEELPASLSTFVLCKEVDKDVHHRLCVLQGLGEDPSPRTTSQLQSEEEEDDADDDEKKSVGEKEINKNVSLCRCASSAITQLLPESRLGFLLKSLLRSERAVSLTQVKSVLEFSLWGPSDVSLGTNVRERESALQRWLDLQRATVLHGLVCAHVKLTVYEECHLLFLVRSNAKTICDASLLVESSAHTRDSTSKL